MTNINWRGQRQEETWRAYLDELAEAAGVVVDDRTGVAKGFQQRVDLQDALLKRARAFAESQNLLDDELGRFGLAGTTFTADDTTLFASPSVQTQQN